MDVKFSHFCRIKTGQKQGMTQNKKPIFVPKNANFWTNSDQKFKITPMFLQNFRMAKMRRIALNCGCNVIARQDAFLRVIFTGWRCGLPACVDPSRIWVLTASLRHFKGQLG